MARMETVNSKNEVLSTPEVITMALEQLDSDQYTLDAAFKIIAKEAETADIVQFGNTVFLANKGKNGNRNKLVGRAFNVDVARNFIDNSLDYIEYLQEKGITHYTTIFEGSEILKLMQFLQRFLKNTDTNIYVGEDANGKYIAYLKIGNDPIPEVS